MSKVQKTPEASKTPVAILCKRCGLAVAVTTEGDCEVCDKEINKS